MGLDQAENRLIIDDYLKLMETDTVNYTSIYIGDVGCLKPANDLIEWEEDEQYLEYFGIAARKTTLRKISEQIRNKLKKERPIITVFVNGPLSGKIYQYGKYGDKWVNYGTTIGYA